MKRKKYERPNATIGNINDEAMIMATSDFGGPRAGDVKPPTIEDNNPMANDADNPNIIKGNSSVWD